MSVVDNYVDKITADHKHADILAQVDEAMGDFVSPEEAEEHGGLYEAYCETCSNEAGNKVFGEMMDKYKVPAAFRENVEEELRNYYDVEI